VIDQEKKEAAFRGRKLFATELELPEGYSGSVLQNMIDNKSWKCIGKCEKINLWEQDSRYGSREGHKANILSWIDISNVVRFHNFVKNFSFSQLFFSQIHDE
jgi:hypothetical protein